MVSGKLTVVVGLPGSGKSTLVKQLRSSVSGLCIEDFHANAIQDSPRVRDSRHFRALVEAIQAGHDCVIADIDFCLPERMSELEETVRRLIPNLGMEVVYFENAPAKCRQNICWRNRPSLRGDLSALDRLAPLYVIPAGVTPRPIQTSEVSP